MRIFAQNLNQHVQLARLYKVLIEFQFRRTVQVLLIRIASQRDESLAFEFWHRAKSMGQPEPAHSRHLEVEDKSIGIAGDSLRNRLDAIVGNVRDKSPNSQERCQSIRSILVIVDN